MLANRRTYRANAVEDVFTSDQLIVDHRSERKTALGISDVQLTADPFAKPFVRFADGREGREEEERKRPGFCR
jgi:hypothetical protein